MKVSTALVGLVIASFAVHASGASLGSFIREKSYDGKLAKTAFVIRDSYPVTALVWSGDGKYLASASTWSNMVHIWSVNDRKLVRELKLTAAASSFHSLSWSSDGRFLAVCDGGAGLRVFKAASWDEPRRFDPAILGGCLQSAFSSDGRQLAVLNSSVHVLDVSTGQEQNSFDLKKSEPGSRIRAISFVPGTRTLVLAGSAYVNVPSQTEPLQRSAGFVWILEDKLPTPQQKIQVYRPYTVDGGAGSIVSVSVKNDASQFATGTRTGDGSGTSITRQSVHILKFPSGELLGAPLDERPFGAQQGLSYTSDGQYLIVGHQDSATKAIHIVETRGLQIVDEIVVSDAVADIAADPTRAGFAAAFGKQIAGWAIPISPRTH